MVSQRGGHHAFIISVEIKKARETRLDFLIWSRIIQVNPHDAMHREPLLWFRLLVEQVANTFIEHNPNSDIAYFAPTRPGSVKLPYERHQAIL